MKCRYRIMKTKLLLRVRTKNGTVDKVKVNRFNNSADLIELLKQEFFTVDSTTVGKVIRCSEIESIFCEKELV